MPEAPFPVMEAPFPVEQDSGLVRRKNGAKEDTVPVQAKDAAPLPRVSSVQKLKDGLHAVGVGPTQAAALRASEEPSPQTGVRSRGKTGDPAQRPLSRLLAAIGCIALAIAVVLCLSGEPLSSLPGLVSDVALLRRAPWSAQDNSAAAVAFVLSLLPLVLVDYTVCANLGLDAGARWFLLHALGK